MLSGDAGHLEYIPREPYRITVEGKTAYQFDISVADFIRQFESPPFEDELGHADVWRQMLSHVSNGAGWWLMSMTVS